MSIIFYIKNRAKLLIYWICDIWIFTLRWKLSVFGH